MNEQAIHSSPGTETAHRPPQDISHLVMEFEGRITQILGGIADKVNSLESRLDGATLALAGGAGRQTAASADNGFPTLPVAEISAQTEREIDARFGDGSPQSLRQAEAHPPAHGEPGYTAAAMESGEPVALHVAAASASVPAASSDVPLGPHTQAVEERRLQSAQSYDSVTL